MKSNNCTTITPWGRADYSYHLDRGAVWYNTPGHGGLGVTLQWAASNLTPQARQLGMRMYGKLWYEEDCQCAIVFFEHPELEVKLFSVGKSVDDIRASCERTIRMYDAVYFDPNFQILCADNPVNPKLQVGDKVRLDRWPALYNVIGAVRGLYMVECGGTVYKLRQSTVFEAAIEVVRKDGSRWQDVRTLWTAIESAVMAAS